MRALIVDDSVSARAMGVALLREAASALPPEFCASDALVIETADCGVEAVKVLASASVDVLLVDLHLPDLTGLDVIHFWKRRTAGLTGVALVMSALISEIDRQRAKDAGATGFLSKPIALDDMVLHLSRHCGAKR
jgi:CheY-like chemotaxis protein